MRPTLTRSSLGLVLALALGASGSMPAAHAADFGAAPVYPGSINTFGGPTPVPAPIPVPVYEPDWYFRVDFGAGFGTQPTVTSTGTPFGNGAAFHGIGLFQGWLTEDFLPSFTGTLGVGYVWNSCFRTDFTVDLHSIMTAQYAGNEIYTAGGALTPQLNVDDKTKFMSTILLFNGYYDIRTGTAFTPYLGGGLGFAVNQLTRTDVFADTSLGQFTFSNRSMSIKFAGAAMAGLTYDVNSFVSLDVGYRYLFIGGSDASLQINGVDTDVNIGTLSEQQVRAGLRFYVD